MQSKSSATELKQTRMRANCKYDHQVQIGTRYMVDNDGDESVDHKWYITEDYVVI